MNWSLSSLHLFCFEGLISGITKAPPLISDAGVYFSQESWDFIVNISFSFMADFSHYLASTSHSIFCPLDLHLGISAVGILKRLQSTHGSVASPADST